MRALAFAAARLLNALYFVGSFVYCSLSYSEFAYEQFIRPQLIGWLPDLVARHHEMFWLTLLVTVPTLVPALEERTARGRTAAALYVGLNMALGVWLVVNPVLALVAHDTRSLVVAFLCLVPPLGLAVVDHLTAAPPSPRAIDEPHLFLGAVTASVAIWLAYVVLIPWNLPRTRGVARSLAGLGLLTVTDSMRVLNRHLIRDQTGQIAAEYRFSPTP